MKKLVASVVLILVVFAARTQDVKTIRLTAHMLGELELYDGNEIDIWGFIYTDSAANPDAPNELPSPVIEFTEGDSIYMIMDNGSNLPHTVHLHGMDVGQANDGVPCTSFQIEGYRTGTYRLRVKHAGTFLYHCHFETHIHLQMGMYGAVIVRPPNEPKAVYDASTRFTKEYVWLGSEIDADWHEGELVNGDQPDYSPNYFLLNGKEKGQIKADPKTYLEAMVSDTVLLRLANMGYGINKFVFPSKMNAKIIGSDGRKFAEVERTDTVFVYPGERYAVFVQADEAYSDSVKVEYLDNYQNKLWAANYIPVNFAALPLSTKELSKDFLFTITEEAIKLTFPDNAYRHCAVHDLSGRQMNNVVSTERDIFLPKESLQPGVYVIRVYEKGGSSATKILIR